MPVLVEFEYLLLSLSNMTDEQPRANLKYTMEEDLDGTEDCRPASSMVGKQVKQKVPLLPSFVK